MVQLSARCPRSGGAAGIGRLADALIPERVGGAAASDHNPSRNLKVVCFESWQRMKNSAVPAPEVLLAAQERAPGGHAPDRPARTVAVALRVGQRGAEQDAALPGDGAPRQDDTRADSPGRFRSRRRPVVHAARGRGRLVRARDPAAALRRQGVLGHPARVDGPGRGRHAPLWRRPGRGHHAAEGGDGKRRRCRSTRSSSRTAAARSSISTRRPRGCSATRPRRPLGSRWR